MSSDIACDIVFCVPVVSSFARKIPKQVPPIAPIKQIMITITIAGTPPAAIAAPILLTPVTTAFPASTTTFAATLTVLIVTLTVACAVCFVLFATSAVFFVVDAVVFTVFFAVFTVLSAFLMLFAVASRLLFDCFISVSYTHLTLPTMAVV